ncbi:MAG: PhoH family protein, partial [Bacillales bacterium]
MTDQLHQIDIPMDDVNVTRELFGINDIFLRRIEEQLDVKLVARGGQIFVKGEKHDIVETVLNNLLAIVESGMSLTERDVIYAVKLAEQGKIDQIPTLFEDEIIKNARGNSIRAKTLGQQQYVHAIENKDLVFGIGPAGTGKTYL